MILRENPLTVTGTIVPSVSKGRLVGKLLFLFTGSSLRKEMTQVKNGNLPYRYARGGSEAYPRTTWGTCIQARLLTNRPLRGVGMKRKSPANKRHFGIEKEDPEEGPEWVS